MVKQAPREHEERIDLIERLAEDGLPDDDDASNRDDDADESDSSDGSAESDVDS